jgi:hypothetical protein
MPKKIFFVTVLLLLISVQALTVSCDVRCSLMGASMDSRTSHSDMKMPHCHGMSMGQDKQPNLTASDSCGPGGCGTQLNAIAKSVDQKNAGSSKLLVSAVALFADPFGSSGTNSRRVLASLSPTSDSRPLVQRPGASLRI